MTTASKRSAPPDLSLAALDESADFKDADGVWSWALIGAVAVAAVAIASTWRIATWHYTAFVSEPGDEKLGAELMKQVNRLGTDEHRWLCGLLAEGTRLEQQVLQKALNDLPSYHAQPDAPDE